MAPVRVRFGHVAAEDEMIFLLFDEHREVRGEGGVVRGRDEDRERVRAHEGDGVGVVVHAEVFGNVHVVFFRPFGVFGAQFLPLAALGLRRGLHSFAASQLGRSRLGRWRLLFLAHVDQLLYSCYNFARFIFYFYLKRRLVFRERL